MDKKTKYDHLKQLVKSQHNLVDVDVDAFVIGSLGKARLNLLPEGEVRERMTKCPSCSSKHQSCGSPQAILPRLLTHCPLNSHADCHAGRQDETADQQPSKRSQILSSCKKAIAEKYACSWESHLQQLEVQSKLLEVLPLGSEDHLWQRLLIGMPEGHLSFVLRASCDCLPAQHL